MLNSIINFSIKNKLVIGLFILGLIVWGVNAITKLPIDAVPDITNNQVQVITVSPTLAAQEVERLITFPVEQTMATIPEIEEIRSFSRFGLSVVTIVFHDNTNLYWARQQVSERLVEAADAIPPGAGKPALAPVTTGLGEIYQYVLKVDPAYREKYSPTDLRTIQDWIIRRQLVGTEGVAEVSSFGGFLKQYEVAVDPQRLRSLDITITDVFNALEANNSNTGGAYIEKGPNAYFIRSEGMITNEEDIRKIVVKKNTTGVPLLVRDVAEVKIGHAIRYGAMTYGDKGETVGAIVMMLKGANSGRVIENVKERISHIEKTLPPGVHIEPYLDRTKLVDAAIHTVVKNLAEGALIVIFVLVLLLGNLRAGLLVASVIPLAMLFAIGMMNLTGVSGNLMSLGAIDFGLIVDGAVIIVEATLHYMHKHFRGKEMTRSELEENVKTSAGRMMGSAAFGQLIILIVYLPILSLSGVEGKMFGPMAQTVAYAILGAFLLSLTYVPMMATLVMSRKHSEKKNISDRIMERLERVYLPVLRLALKWEKLIVATSVTVLIIAFYIFSGMGGEFIPTLDEGDFAIETRTLTGGSLDNTVNAALKASAILEKFPEVERVVGKVGSSEVPVDPMPVEACDLIVVLKPHDQWVSASTREELADTMSKALAAIPWATFGFQQPIQMRFNELMSGARQDIVVKIYGDDLDVLSEYAKQIGELAKTVEGAEDLYVEEVTGLSQVIVRIDRNALARYGVSVDDVNNAVRAGFAGAETGLVFEGDRRFSLVVRVGKENRKDEADLGSITVTTSDGQQIPVSELAEIKTEVGPNQIQRDNAQRRITVGFNVRGRDIQSVVEELQKKVEKEVKFKPGYYPTYGGTFKNLEDAQKRLSIAVPVALLMILLMLYFTFHSVKHALLIFSAIPMSAIGGIFMLWFRDMPFSISAGVGFIALFGVAVLNGIVLIAEFNRLKDSGVEDVDERIFKGAHSRLRPVVMTAMVASLGFLPMAISSSSGAEVQRPLASVVIGGLITSTLLTLILLPVLYHMFSTKRKKKNTTEVKTTSAILIAILLLSGMSLSAQQNNTYTMKQVLDSALKKNNYVKAAGLDLNAAKATQKAALDFGSTNATFTTGNINSAYRDKNITVIHTLPSPGVISASRKIAKAETGYASLNLAATEADIAYRTKASYMNLLYLHQYKKLLLREDSIYKAYAISSAKKYTAGEITLLQKLNAENLSLQASSRMMEIDAEIKAEEKLLASLCGIQGVIIPSETEFPKLSPLSYDTVSRPVSVQLAFQYADIQYGRVRAERNKLLPQFTVGGFTQSLYGYQNTTGTDVFYGSNMGFRGVQAGLNIPFPFNAQASRIKSAKISYDAAMTRAEAQSRQVNAERAAAISKLQGLEAKLNWYKTSALPQAALLKKQADLSWKAGETGSVEYQQSLQSALIVEQEYLHTLYLYNRAVIELDYLNGKF
ncbi:MAG: CusA/CzcA family heavy metal efflux RND transporter [Bacteroidia bacterium]